MTRTLPLEQQMLDAADEFAYEGQGHCTESEVLMAGIEVAVRTFIGSDEMLEPLIGGPEHRFVGIEFTHPTSGKTYRLTIEEQ